MLVTGPASGAALAAWQAAHGHDGPVEELFGVACLGTGSPGGVAGSLYRAAAAAGKGPEGAVA